jgi:hypothetical protein
METMVRETYQAMGYDTASGIPSRALLESLALLWVAQELYGG